MRINKFIAQATGLSRRKADEAIAAGRVTVDGRPAKQGMDITGVEQIRLDESAITPPVKTLTIMLNKPAGYVVSRDGQGSKTVYDLLPQELHHLKPVGRLDKDSSGLLLMTNDGDLANQLTHPSHQKLKIYQVTLDKPLQPLHHQMICDHGIRLDDGYVSKFQITKIDIPASRIQLPDSTYEVRLAEGKNRQIRRTFEALGYKVTKLHRTNFGAYRLNKTLKAGHYQTVS